MSTTEQDSYAMFQLLVPQERRRLLGAVLVVIVAVFLLVFSNVDANHSPMPHDLPIGIVGSASVVNTVSEQLPPGDYSVHGYSSLAAAKTAIQDRTIYGGFQPGMPAVILVATAASVPVANLLQSTFASAAQKAGESYSVENVVPLPSSDSSGATGYSGILSLLIAGLAGTSIIFNNTKNRSVISRLAAITAVAVGGGLAFVLVTNVIVGAFHGPPSQFFALWGVAALFILAVGVPITAFQVLLGAGGIAVGWLLFFVIGNPASGGSSAPQLLPPFWGTLSQLLPPGAATTSVRDVVYFHGNGDTGTLIVLAAYAVVGSGLAVLFFALRGHGAKATAAA